MSGAGVIAVPGGMTLAAAHPAATGAAGATRLLWALILATAALLAAGLAATGLTLAHIAQAWPMALPIPVCLAVTLVYRHLRPVPRIADFAEDACQMIVIIGLMAILDYVAAVAGTGFAYRDSWLAAADATIGLDWPSYIAFVDARPWLAALLAVAYVFINPMFLLVLGALTLTGRRARMQHFLLALWLSLALTLAVFVLMPALGGYAHFAIAGDSLAHLHPLYLTAGIAPALDALRTTGPLTIPLDELKGLADFPSFHTAGALLFIWALWPLPRLRWAALAANLLTLAATPVEGAHYFADMLAGTLVAVIAITLAASWLRMTRRTARQA